MSSINRLPCLLASGCIGPLQAAVDDKDWGSEVIYSPGFLPTVWFWASCIPPPTESQLYPRLPSPQDSLLPVLTTTPPLASHAFGGNGPVPNTQVLH